MAAWVSVLGCGWLGFPLAVRLLKEGYQLRGSTTSPQKINVLENAGVTPYQITYHPSQKTNVQDFFQSEVLFLNIPFRRGLTDPSLYALQIESVIEDAKKGSIKSLIFTSSTAVYPEHLKAAKEEADFIPVDGRARVLFDVERKLLVQKSFATTIVRFGGLYGQGRPIGKFLAGKTDIADPHKPVNLIHLDDCVEIVTRLIRKGAYSGVLNAVSDRHPTRQELYTKAARSLGLRPPTFLEQKIQQDYKVVSNDKLKKALDYHFIHPDPMTL